MADKDVTTAGLTGAGTGALTGAGAGAAIAGPVGAAVGAVAGGLIGAFTAVKRTKEQKELEKAAEQQARVQQDQSMRMAKLGSADTGQSGVIPAPTDAVMAAAPGGSSFDSWLARTF